MSLSGIMQKRIFFGRISVENFTVFALHSIAWLVIFLVPQLFENHPSGRTANFSLILNLTGFVVFYLNFFWLTPRFLLQRKHFMFLLFVVLIFLVVLFVVEPFLNQLMKNEFVRNFNPDMKPPDFKKWDENREMMRPGKHIEFRKYLNLIFLVVTYLTFSSAIRIFQKLKKEEGMNQLYRNEKLHAELMMFRQQVNPHFLFNSLNNIQSLVNSQSTKTVEAISKLSSILRYMLNESENDQIPLSRELDMIRDYIEFQQLRLKDRLEVDCVCDELDKDYYIEPFILNPLVENAFKYGVFPGEQSRISIHLSMNDGWLSFSIKNSIEKEKKSARSEEGIGIKNVVRRLELSYQEAYQFNQWIDNNEWHIRLLIQLRKGPNEEYDSNHLNN